MFLKIGAPVVFLLLLIGIVFGIKMTEMDHRVGIVSKVENERPLLCKDELYSHNDFFITVDDDNDSIEIKSRDLPVSFIDGDLVSDESKVKVMEYKIEGCS